MAGPVQELPVYGNESPESVGDGCRLCPVLPADVLEAGGGAVDVTIGGVREPKPGSGDVVPGCCVEGPLVPLVDGGAVVLVELVPVVVLLLVEGGALALVVPLLVTGGAAGDVVPEVGVAVAHGEPFLINTSHSVANVESPPAYRTPPEPSIRPASAYPVPTYRSTW